MRGILELHLRCSSCGEELEFVYKNDVAIPIKNNKSTETTGALKVAEPLFVKPCSTCLRPLREMKQAINILKGIDNV